MCHLVRKDMSFRIGLDVVCVLMFLILTSAACKKSDEAGTVAETVEVVIPRNTVGPAQSAAGNDGTNITWPQDFLPSGASVTIAEVTASAELSIAGTVLGSWNIVSTDSNGNQIAGTGKATVSLTIPSSHDAGRVEVLFQEADGTFTKQLVTNITKNESTWTIEFASSLSSGIYSVVIVPDTVQGSEQDTTSETPQFALASGQTKPAIGFPINLLVKFSDAIAPSTFTEADLKPASLTWGVPRDTGDNMTFTVSIIAGIEGVHALTVATEGGQDFAGNGTLASLPFALTVDLPGATPNIALLVPSSSPSVTSLPQFRVTGSLRFGDTVALYNTEACTGQPLASTKLSAAASSIDLTVTVAVPADLALTYYAGVTDPLGNVTCSSGVVYQRNTVGNAVSISLANGFNNPGSTLPIEFSLTTTLAIDPASFTASDLLISSNVFSSEITNSGNDRNFTLRLWTQAGSVNVGLNTGSVTTSQGIANASSSPATSTLNIAERQRFVQVDGELHHFCGVSSAGQAYCWGAGDLYQIGNNSNANRNVPTAVSAGANLQPFRKVTAGYGHSCGITAAGAAYCWGNNSYGQLGDGTSTSPRPTPVAVVSGENTTNVPYVDIEAGTDFTCALSAAGIIYCWGSDYLGRLGNGGDSSTSPDVLAPGAIVNGANSTAEAYIALDAAQVHVCALTVSGNSYCWGGGYASKLGNNSFADSHSPVAAAGAGKPYVRIRAGYDHSCALGVAGNAYCWGLSGQGQLGIGSTPGYVISGTIVAAGANTAPSLPYKDIELGQYHTCGIVDSGKAYCWGIGYAGSAYNSLPVGDGDPSAVGRSSPVAVVSGANTANQPYAAIALNAINSCALTAAGNLYCWGINNPGSLGNSSAVPSATPVATTMSGLPVGDAFATLALGSQHGCASSAAGHSFCWGANDRNQLGNLEVGAIRSLPVPIDTTNLSTNLLPQLSLGNKHSCSLSDQGTAFCWGSGAYGQIGNSATSDRNIATATSGGLVFRTIVAGGNHTCGLSSFGLVSCWGKGDAGQLGNAAFSNQTAPVSVSGGSTVAFKQIALGVEHSCALSGAGALSCWGSDAYGQLGTSASTANQGSPTLVSLGLKFASIAAGDDHSCAINAVGAAYCWGRGNSGQLGTSTTTNADTPSAVSGSLLFRTLAAGTSHTCGLTAAGILYCWGNDTYGQLGNAAIVGDKDTPSAVDVSALVANDLFVQIKARGNTTCGISGMGRTYCWGEDTTGQLGNGQPTVSSTLPVLMHTSP